ncbi:TauD-domain-containing protein [Meredithblackwellia eburnea MCA 4105]
MPPTATETTLTTPLQSRALRFDPQPTPVFTPQDKSAAEDKEWRKNYKYAKFLPSYDHSIKLPPLEPFEHVDPGHRALLDPAPQSFLTNATLDSLTPDFGTEVTGIQLTKLTSKELDQLALFIAQRGVVAFRDQDFIDADPDWQLHTFGAHFGKLHVHQTSGQPEGIPELHLVYRDKFVTHNRGYADGPEKVTSTAWHSDVTYEAQPPSVTALFLYTSPPSGGDTLYADQRAAYNHLSPSFREYLETLEVLHSGKEQAESSLARGGVLKRDWVQNVHPLVRTHPVTGKKALFVNPGFARRIIGLKQEESDALLRFLFDHIAKATDIQVRVRWRPKTVVLWDNRITVHSAIADFGSTGQVRHGARITPQGERPFLRK